MHDILIAILIGYSYMAMLMTSVTLYKGCGICRLVTKTIHVMVSFTASHFGGKKTRATIICSSIWPGIH